MPKLNSLALTASCSALLLCIASPSSALSGLELVYLGGGTGNFCINGTSATPGNPGLGSGDCIEAQTGDIIRFAIAITVDTLGVVAWGFDLRWDRDGEDELDLVNHRERPSLLLLVDPGPPPSSLAFILDPLESTQESSSGTEGHLHGYDGLATAISPPFPASVSFRVGVVEFQVTGNLNSNAGADIELGFFRLSGPGFGDANLNNQTPSFSSFALDRNIVPEPGTIVLLSMGVLALGLAHKREPGS